MEKQIKDLEYYQRQERLYDYAKEFQLQLAKDGFYALYTMDINIHLIDEFDELNFTGGSFNAFQSHISKPNPVIRVYTKYIDETTIKKKMIIYKAQKLTNRIL